LNVGGRERDIAPLFDPPSPTIHATGHGPVASFDIVRNITYRTAGRKAVTLDHSEAAKLSETHDAIERDR
jgi:hypothetical protein